MAEKKIIIDVEVKNSNAVKAISDFTAKVEELKRQRAELTQKQKDGVISEEQARAKSIELTQQIKAITAESRTYEKTIQSEIKAQNAQAGSLDELKAKLSLQTAAYGKLNKEQQNTEGGKAMQQSIRATSDELKKLEGDLGNNARKVGSYSEALELLPSGFAGGIQGAKAFGLQMLALLANPIVAVIAAAVGVFMLLKKALDSNGSATEKFNQVLAPFKNLISLVMTALGALVDVIMDGVLAYQEFANSILELIPFMDKIAAKNREAIELEKSKQRIAEENRKEIVNDAKDELAVADLKNKIAQKDKYTTQERLAFAKEADRISAEMMRDDVNRAIRSYNDKVKEMKNANRQYKDLTDAEKEDLRNAEAAAFNARKEYAEGTRKLKANQAAMLAEIEADKNAKIEKNEAEREKSQQKRDAEKAKAIANQEKADAAEQKRIDDKLKNDIDTLNAGLAMYKAIQDETIATKEQTDAEMLQLDKDLAAKETSTQLAILEARKLVEVENAEAIEAEILLTKQNGKVKQAQLDVAFQEKQKQNAINAAKQNADIEMILAQDNIDALFILKQQALEVERLAEIEAAEKIGASVELINKKYAKADEDLQRETLTKKSEAVLMWADQAGQAMNGLNDLQKNIEAGRMQELEGNAEREQEIIAQKLANGTISKEQAAAQEKKIAKGLDDEKKKLALEQAKREKALNIFSIIVNTAAGIVAQMKAGPTGIPLAIAAGVIGAIQLATAIAAPLPKASKGMMLAGKSHAQGGIPIEVEGGEAIINKKSTSMYGDLLSEINQAGGGVPFQTAGSDGGFSMRNGGGGLTAGQVESAMTNAINKLRVVASIADIIKAEEKYTAVEVSSTY